MTTKRLLKVEKGRGVYQITEPGIGTWTEVLPLPREPRKLGSMSPLPVVDTGPKLHMPGGLYGSDEERRANERRRKADAVLEQAGLRPRSW